VLSAISSKQLCENVGNNGMPYDPLPELLALKAIVRVLLAEKIRDFKDEVTAAFELAASCSEIVNDAHPSGPDPEGTKQEALRHLDNIFGALKKA
jgi:hypothetical protein